MVKALYLFAILINKTWINCGGNLAGANSYNAMDSSIDVVTSK